MNLEDTSRTPASLPTEPLPDAPVSAGPAVAPHPGSTPPPGSGAARPRSRAAAWVNVALGAALLVAVAGTAFAVGRMSAPATAAGAGNGNGNFGNGFVGRGYFRGGQGVPGEGGGRGIFGAGGLAIDGTVESISGSTLTLKTSAGQTIQIALNGSTTYHAQTSATASDVQDGAKVSVRVDLRPQDANGAGMTAGDVTVVP